MSLGAWNSSSWLLLSLKMIHFYLSFLREKQKWWESILINSQICEVTYYDIQFNTLGISSVLQWIPSSNISKPIPNHGLGGNKYIALKQFQVLYKNTAKSSWEVLRCFFFFSYAKIAVKLSYKIERYGYPI